MNIYNDDILPLLLVAFVLGALSGVIYDVLHILVFAPDKISTKTKKLFCAIEYISLFVADLLSCLVFCAGALILMYNLNKGVFRCTVYILMGFGFLIYRITVSKPIRRVLSFALNIIKCIIRIVCRIISIPLRVIFKIYHLTIGKIVCIIIGGIRNKREAKRQRKREKELVALSNSGKDEYVAPKENSENTRKERIFIGRKNA